MKLIKSLLLLAALVALSPIAFGSGIDVVDQNGLTQHFEQRVISEGLGRNLADENPLYQTILNEFQDRYQEIGERELKVTENGRDMYVWGGLNHIGLTYTKSWVDFSVELRRDLAPDLFDNTRWIVTDNFTIYIDASKFLSNLKEEGVIEIGESEYAAFAGVTFKRAYKHVHFADSYQEGLGFNLDKLFLGFQNFRSKNYLNLSPYEFITKEDSLSFALGGVASVPVYGPISAGAGVLAKYQKLNKISIQALGPDDPKEAGEFLRVGVEKEKAVSVGVSASLMLDFMNLLRISLLSYDFEYQLNEAYRLNLSFKESDRDTLASESGLSQEMSKALKGKKYDREVLAPYTVSEEHRIKQTQKSRYSLLLLGGAKEKQTEMIQVQKDGTLTTFFRHHFEQLSYTQNLLSRLFKVVLKSFLQLDSIVKNVSTDKKTLRFEYQSKKDLIKAKEDITLDESDEKLSLNLMRKFYAWKINGFGHRSKKKRALNFLNHYSGINPAINDLVETKGLVGPIRIESNMQMGKDGMNYFNGLSQNRIYDLIDLTCHDQSKGIFKFFRSLFGGCKRGLQKRFDKYWLEYATDQYSASSYKSCKKKVRRKWWKSARKKRILMQQCMFRASKKVVSERKKNIPLWRFKDFMEYWFKKSQHKQDAYNLFGLSNVFFHGKLEAKTPNGGDYTGYFREGKFNGSGVVNNYLRSENLRSPASLIVE